MRLFHSPTSPYVRKVMVQLHETGLLPQVELVTGSGTPVDPGKAPLEANPLGKVPALERKPSVIQVGEDKTADFLRAVNRGEEVAFR